MRIIIENLDVIFPYTLVFNEQIQYMTYLKRTLDSTGHAILQMPTGTGKTISLLALLTSYLSHRTKYKKLIYCTRTVVEMQKTLKQIKSLLKKRKLQQPNSRDFICLGLTAKKNLCVNTNIQQWRKNDSVQGQCKKRTADWIRAKKVVEEGSQIQLCPYYENYKNTNEHIHKIDNHQVFTMQDLRQFGRQSQICPYFLARDNLQVADIIVFNYLYLIDPKISPNFLKDLSKDTIVVFDQAHNIDDICIESYTLKINRNILNNAENNVKMLQSKINLVVDSTKQKYQQEIEILKNKLKDKNNLNNFDQLSNSNIIPQSILNTQTYITSLKIIIQFLRNKLKQKIIRYYDNNDFRKEFQVNTCLENSFFKLANDKLSQILIMLQIVEVQQLKNLNLITFFCSLIFEHTKGFKIIYQPNPMDGNIAQPLLTLACLDCSLSMQPIWRAFPCVILTSGTISPIDLYPRILNFSPIIVKSIDIELGRNPISPLILGTTWNQQPLSSEYKLRSDKNVSRNYGDLILTLSNMIPDGILCFFPSYMYMQHILKDWLQLGIINDILQSRYIFIEKKDPRETQQSIISYRKACDIGRGAIFFAIARGKIAQGVDFQEHYGRCVIMMGFPVQNSLDPVLLERIKFMIQSKQIKDKNQFFQFDTMRQCAQCLGRVMRRKTDYGLMILADSRFRKQSRYQKLPKWILKCLPQNNINVTFEMAFHICSDFFRKMGKQYKLNQLHFKTQKDFIKQ